MPGLERLIFFGTPAFAVPTLDALKAAGRLPLTIVSQPARAAGRGRRLRQPPVAAWAELNGIDLMQPERVRDHVFLRRMEALDLDIAVVVAFGQIFPAELLALPRCGCINLHASLLPEYRGAAPVAAAIAHGDQMSGVSTMLMEQGLDTGPVLLQREVAVGPSETTGELELRMATIGAGLVIETLDGLECGKLEPQPQDETLATHAPRLKKADGLVDWSWSAQQLFDRLRAFTPWPGLGSTLRGRPVKLRSGRPLVHRDDSSSDGAAPSLPGSYLGVQDGCIIVTCGDGTRFCIESLQRPGRKPISGSDFANGEHLEIGERFG